MIDVEIAPAAVPGDALLRGRDGGIYVVRPRDDPGSLVTIAPGGHVERWPLSALPPLVTMLVPELSDALAALAKVFTIEFLPAPAVSPERMNP